ncbi:uncharacterized protein DDB_G0283357-like [Haliotis asinina]|uniref:uncharacterized protein DDB_G0283357-like n=1 Tax=Haliotis asinina TaxID=109174 RepID=UPI003531CC6E
MSSGYQGYYDSFQYNQNYDYNQQGYTQGTQYQEQCNNNQYGQSFDQNNQYQTYGQNSDFNSSGQYTPGYNQNNNQFTGQYSAQNANDNQYGQSSTTGGSYGQYVSNGTESSSSAYSPSFTQNSFPADNTARYSQTAASYSSYSPANKDFNQNSVSGYGQSSTTNPGFSQGQKSAGYNGNTAYGQTNSYQNSGSYQASVASNSVSGSAYSQNSGISNNYGQNGGQYGNQFGQNQFNQRKQNGPQSSTGGEYSSYKFDTQPPPPPPPSHVQHTQRTGNYGSNNTPSRYPDTSGRGQSYDRTMRGRSGMDQYSTRGQGPTRGGRGGSGFSASFSQGQGQSDPPRVFGGRGNRGGRFVNQVCVSSPGGYSHSQTREKNIQQNSEEVMTKYSDLKPKSILPAGKENVPKFVKEEQQPVVSGDDIVPAEVAGKTVTDLLGTTASTYVIPTSAVTGVGDQILNPEVEAKLRDLMQPLYCRLCSVNLNATSQAQQHYEGKNHAKKLRMFLASSSTSATTSDTSAGGTATGTSDSPAKGKDKEKEKSESTPLDEEVYCKICDVSFTSVKQSTQHYQGKNHAKKVRLASATTISMPSDTVVKGEGTQFECVMCSVHVTSQDQLNMHLNGAKHKHKLRLQQRTGGASRGRWSAGDWSGGGRGRGMEFSNTGDRGGGGFKRPFGRGGNWHGSEDSARSFQPSGPKRPRQDFSNYRTPSGKFYCSCCNVTLNVESQFAQHVASKRHKTNHAMQRNSSDNADAY